MMKPLFLLDRRKKEPLSEQFYLKLKQYILENQHFDDFPLPSIEDFSKTYDLDQQTIQSVLTTLANENIVFYQEQTQQYSILKLNKDSDLVIKIMPIYQAVVESGKKASIHTLMRETRQATAQDVREKGFLLHETIHEFHRLIYADDEVIAHMKTVVSKDLVTQIEEFTKEEVPHLVLLLKQLPNYYRQHTRYLNAEYIDQDLKTYFGNKEKLIVLHGEYSFYSMHGRKVEWGIVTLSDLYHFSMTIPALKSILKA